jgi:hypothetical protein
VGNTEKKKELKQSSGTGTNADEKRKTQCLVGKTNVFRGGIESDFRFSGGPHAAHRLSSAL